MNNAALSSNATINQDILLNTTVNQDILLNTTVNQDILLNAKYALDTEINALQKMSERLDARFADAVKLLSTAHKVVISGVGKSGIVGQKIAATLSSTGITSVFLHPVEALHGDIGMVQKGDVAILLSKSGNTEELVRLIPYLQMRNAKIIAIIGNTTSNLANNADVVLDASVEQEACPFNLAPTSSTTIAMALGDALAVCLMKLRGFTLEDFSRLHPLGQIGKVTNLKVKDVMQKLEKVALASEETIFKDGLIMMTKKNLGCICIASESQHLLGILTDGDVRRVLQKYENALTMPLNELMTTNPITITTDSILVEALAVMTNREEQISVLPVLDNNNLLQGLLRIHDIIGKG